VALFDRTLRARREELALGQAQLAERVGVTQQTISRWENGEVIPPPKRLAKLAKALDLDLDQMLTYGGYLPNVADWPRWHVLNLLYDQIGDLSDDDLVLVMQRTFEEMRSRILGDKQKTKETDEERPTDRASPQMPG
jgi:transcriptional regulator with XRE-family HTH domain